MSENNLRSNEKKTEAELKCKDCSKVFASETDLNSHKSSHDMIDARFADVEDNELVGYDLECGGCQVKIIYVKDILSHRCEKGAESTNKKDLEFKCDYCNETFKYQIDKDSHTKWNHLQKFCCDLCPLITFSKVSITRHMILTHISSPREFKFICDICGKRYLRKSSLKNHILGHFEANSETFKCNRCDKEFHSKNILRQHQKIHVSLRIFDCNECHKSFKLLASLNRHTTFVHLNIRKYKCDICNHKVAKKFMLVAHYKTHSEDRPFKCSLCPLTYKDNKKLERHQLSHSDKRAYKCDKCEKAFKIRDYLVRHQLVRHQLVHSTVRKYKCSKCKKRFKTANEVKYHENQVHSDFKPYKCTVCSKSFNLKTNLTHHYAGVHTTKRLYKCKTCGDSFKTNSTLNRHQLVHSDNRPFKCGKSKCKAAFKTKGELKIHEFSHSSKQHFECLNCGRAYKIQANLGRHFRENEKCKRFNERNKNKVK